MIEVTKRCTGCGACAHICPANAIAMQENEDGFQYPYINKAQCAQCHLCESHCHLTITNPFHPSVDVYAVVAKDPILLARSTSGGAFGVLATAMLERKGVVVGCAYSKSMVPHHLVVRDMEGLKKLHGSKYVESDLEDIYLQVKQLLECNTPVLFAGTGCQVGGLHAFLHQKYECLLTVDLICHGVPSRKLFAQHVAYINKQYHDQLSNEDFRSKSKYPYGMYVFDHHFASGKSAFQTSDFSAYYAHFLHADIYRESCYTCKYANSNRISDFTIGDYWGVERFHKTFPADNGASALIANSDQAKKLAKTLHAVLLMEESKMEWIAQNNQNLIRPAIRPDSRNTIFQSIERDGYDAWEKKFKGSPLYFKKKLISLIPFRMKHFLKLILQRSFSADKM